MNIAYAITGMQKAAGTSVFAGEVANRLVGRGHQVWVAVCDCAARDCYPLDERVRLTSIADLMGILQHKTACPLDVVHIHALWSPILAKVAKMAKKSGVKVVWSPHGMLTPWAMANKRLKKFIGWWGFQRRALMNAEALHVTAQSEVADVRRMGLKNPVFVAPLGVAVAEDASGHKNANRPVRTLLFVSRVQRKKGLPYLLHAWAKLPESLRCTWRMVIAGPDQDNHTSELCTLASQLGISEEVFFLGPVFGEDKDKLYREADLFVLPTHSENFGSVVIESLAAGTPVICTKGAPWAELESHRCGWWIDIGVDPLLIALKESMSLIDDERAHLGQNGIDLVREKYSWDSVVLTMEAAYERI